MNAADRVTGADEFARLLEPVIVVGAGIAGLVVARDLALAGVAVTVLEASDRVGGQLAAATVAGVEVDAAAESFATRDRSVADLLEEIGLGEQIVAPLDAPAWLVRGPRDALPLPAASILGIPATPYASDVTAAIGWGGSFRAQLDSFIPLLRPDRYRTVGELVRARMGSRVLDRLVAPVVRGVHSTTPDALPLDVAAPGLRAALARTGSLHAAVTELRAASPAGSQVNGVAGGMHRIAEALRTRAEVMGAVIRLNTRVVAVDELGVVTADGERLAGRVVVAAPGVASRPARQRRITVAIAAVDAPGLDAHPRGTGALVVAGAEGIVARAFTHSNAKWAWLGEGLPPHRHLVRLSYDEAPADVASTVLADLRAITGAEIGGLADVVTRTWTRTLESEPVAPGIDVVGEAGSASGLARIVTAARPIAARLAGADLNGSDGPGNGEVKE